MNKCLRACECPAKKMSQFVETGTVEEFLQRPSHPYTQELPAAVPEIAAK
jgi:ABC-type dipeptide/oligopeptide/nickel transport system ATPase component